MSISREKLKYVIEHTHAVLPIPNPDINPEVFYHAWMQALDGLQDSDIGPAFLHCMRTMRHFPTPADVIAAHQVVTGGAQ